MHAEHQLHWGIQVDMHNTVYWLIEHVCENNVFSLCHASWSFICACSVQQNGDDWSSTQTRVRAQLRRTWEGSQEWGWQLQPNREWARQRKQQQGARWSRMSMSQYHAWTVALSVGSSLLLASKLILKYQSLGTWQRTKGRAILTSWHYIDLYITRVHVLTFQVTANNCNHWVNGTLSPFDAVLPMKVQLSVSKSENNFSFW